jgi:hypothetical protein
MASFLVGWTLAQPPEFGALRRIYYGFAALPTLQDQTRYRSRDCRGTRQRVSVMHGTLSGQAGQRMPYESRPSERQASPRL